MTVYVQDKRAAQTTCKCVELLESDRQREREREEGAKQNPHDTDQGV